MNRDRRVRGIASTAAVEQPELSVDPAHAQEATTSLARRLSRTSVAVIGLTCARWVTLHFVLSPWIWVGALLGAGLWALAATIGPLGVTTDPGLLARAHYELAFVGALLGAALATAALGRLEALLERAATRDRLLCRAEALLGGALLGLVATGALPFFAGSPLEPGALLVPALIGAAHLVAIALVALELPLAPATRALAVIGIAWLLPAVLGPSVGPLDALARLTDASIPFAAPGTALGPHLGATLPPILAWLFAAILIANGRRETNQHAIRDSR